MRKTRRTVYLICYWLYNNKKENIYLTLQKAIQETGKRTCVWEWNFAVKGERQISTSCRVLFVPSEFCPMWKYYRVKIFSHNCRKYSLSSKLMTPRCLLLPESRSMNAKDEEDQGPTLHFGRISCCDAFNPISTQFLTPVFLIGRCFVEGIKNASLFLIKKTSKQKTVCLQVSSVSSLWCWRCWRTWLRRHHLPHQGGERLSLWVPVPGRFIETLPLTPLPPPTPLIRGRDLELTSPWSAKV